MGFGLIGSALAGGLAGGGAAGERAFARMGEQQGRVELEQMRAQIETDRQTALARLQSDLRRGDARSGLEMNREYAERDRSEVRGLIERGTTGELDQGPATPEMMRTAGRDALAKAGRLKEAADYDKATEPDKPTVVNTPYGGKSTVLGRDGRVLSEIDNSTDIKAQNDRLRAENAGRGRAPKALDQAQVDKVHKDAITFADRLATESPHPLADPADTDKEARKDKALGAVARQYYTRAMHKAITSGVLLDPSEVEAGIRMAGKMANERVLADAEAKAATLFDAKGRPNTGADAAMKEWGIRGAASRDGFLREYRDRYLGSEMDAVMRELQAQARGSSSGGAASGAQPARSGPAGEPPVTEGARPDDPGRLANRPTGLVGGAAAADEAPKSGTEALGEKLDAARNEHLAAVEQLRRFGLRQQKQDPAAFQAAKQREAQAKDAMRAAQQAYERAVGGGNGEVGFSALKRQG